MEAAMRFIETPPKEYKKHKITIKHYGVEQEIKMSNKNTSAIKVHKSTIKTAKQEIKSLRKAKRLAIKQARAEFKQSVKPQRHIITMAKLLLKQAKTTAKIEKLNQVK